MSHQTETPSQDGIQQLALAADFDCLIGATASAPQAPNVARSATAKPFLDSNGKSTCGEGALLERRGAARTIDRYRLQRHAAKILDWPKALSGCEFARQSKDQTVQVWQYTSQDRGSWSGYKGLQTCKNIWGCPVCSNKRAWVRRGELQQLVDYAQAEGLTLVMLTLTSQHDLETRLRAQLLMMKKAKKGLPSRAGFKKGLARHLVGSVTATEVTQGLRTGWHAHFHYIIVLDLKHLPVRARDSYAAELGEIAWPAWQGAAEAVGLHVSRRAYSVDVGETVAKYPGAIEKVESNWTLADEATRGAAKKGTGRHPFELLRLSCDENDEAARALFIEYAQDIKGTRALMWSKGLAELVGVKKSKDATEDGQQDDKPAEEAVAIESKLAGELSQDHWEGRPARPGVRARRGRMSVAVARAGVKGFELERDNAQVDPLAGQVASVLDELGEDCELINDDEIDDQDDQDDELAADDLAWIHAVIAACDGRGEMPPQIRLNELATIEQLQQFELDAEARRANASVDTVAVQPRESSTGDSALLAGLSAAMARREPSRRSREGP